jgi:nucleoside-diphosphate-sugar epimerase
VIVVTGAAGFIGTQVCVALASGGRAVAGLDRLAASHDAADRWLTADLAAIEPGDPAWTALREAEAIVHLAATPGVRAAGAEAERARHRDNFVATGQVLAAAPRETYVVVASSSSVYGGARRGVNLAPSSEGMALRPRGGYALSKVAAEGLCAARGDAGGEIGVVRPFTVAGERQRPDMAISRWLAAALRREPFTVLGSLDRTRDVTDVKAVADGIVRMIDRRVCSTVNLGTGVRRSIREMIGAVASVLDVPVAIDLRSAGSEEATDTWADTTRCRQLLGSVPSTDLVDVVARQAAAVAVAAER